MLSSAAATALPRSPAAQALEHTHFRVGRLKLETFRRSVTSNCQVGSVWQTVNKWVHEQVCAFYQRPRGTVL